MDSVKTVDCHYLGLPDFAAAFLLREGDRAAFIETNTERALPRLLEALEEQGLEPEQVDYVIITHVHLDHAGGAAALMEACPNATLLAHPRARPHVVDPSKLVKSSIQVYGEARFAELYGEVKPLDEARTRVMEDGEVLEWGERKLTFLYTRGHANHHFCIHDSKSEGVFTGDSLGLIYPSLQSGGLFVVASTTPTDFDADAALESIERIVRTGAKRAYLTHFGAWDDPAAIGAALRPQLVRYGAIVKEAFDADLDGDALDAFCAKEVRALVGDLLEEHGLADDAAARQMLETDIDLNGQGVAFAVKKARFKAGR